MIGRFLPDYGADGERDVIAKWKAGNLSLASDQYGRGYLCALEEVANISLDGIVQYYGVAEEFSERIRKARAP